MGSKMALVLQVLLDNEEEALSNARIMDKLAKMGYEFNRKEIIKVINTINDFFSSMIGKPLIEGKRKKGYFISSEVLEDGELQFLLDSIAYNRDASLEEKEDLKDKLFVFSSIHQKERISEYMNEEGTHDFSLMLNLTNIMHAIDEKKNIVFKYVDYKEENKHPVETYSTHGNDPLSNENYIVSPYRIFLNNNHYYMIGHNSKRKDEPTTYRIDRMRLVRSHSGSYVDITEQYDLDDHINKNFNTFLIGDLVTLKFRFKDFLLREVVSRFGSDVRIEKKPNGWYEGEIDDISLTMGLKMWFMMQGANMRVMAPVSLRDDITKDLQTALEQYKNGKV